MWSSIFSRQKHPLMKRNGSIPFIFSRYRQIHVYANTLLRDSEGRMVGAVTAVLDDATSSEITDEERYEKSTETLTRHHSNYQQRSMATYFSEVLGFAPEKTSSFLSMLCQPACAKFSIEKRKIGKKSVKEVESKTDILIFEPIHAYACTFLRSSPKRMWQLGIPIINQAVYPYEDKDFERSTLLSGIAMGGRKRIISRGIIGEPQYLDLGDSAVFNHESTNHLKQTAIPTLIVTLDIEFFGIDIQVILSRLDKLRNSDKEYHSDSFNCSHALNFALTGSESNRYAPPQLWLRNIAIKLLNRCQNNAERESLLNQFYQGMQKTRISINPVENGKLVKRLHEEFGLEINSPSVLKK